jgi:hypothetical protein
MKDVLIENGQDIFLNTCQQLIQVVMEQFARVDHGYEDLVLDSEQLFKDVHLLVDQHVLEQDNVIRVLSLVGLVKLLHFVDVHLASIGDKEK